MDAAPPDPALLFPDPPLASLNTVFASIALRRGLALKFPREVAPFAALLEPSPAALADLHSLLEPAESVFVIPSQPLPSAPGLTSKGPYAVAQYEFPAKAPLPPLSPELPIEPLTCAHAAEMVSLTSVAYPGFFRSRTCEMGPYFGIRSRTGQLVAMVGERMSLRTPTAHFVEISGLCTHPDHRGHGYAPALLAHILHLHRDTGRRSYLHVAADNPAIALYTRLGFLPRGQFLMLSLRRS